MGQMSVHKLLISMSVPMIISMLVQALYNVVDSVFVSRIGEHALTAVSLVFPVQNMIISVAVGTAVGVNALLSRCLGEKNFKDANSSAVNGVFLAVVSYIVFLFVGILFSKPFMLTQTTDPIISSEGKDYMFICCVCSLGVFIEVMFERLLQATGRTFYTMITQGLGAVINIILDPIFIFGWLGIPAMGVAGAALATVIGQISAAILAAWFNFKKNPEISIKFKNFRPDWKIIKKIYAVGVPSIIMSSISSIMTFAMNKILIGFTTTATAVFGVYFKLQSFVFMPVFGLTNGMLPIVAYNFGARKKKRMIDTIKLSACYAVGMMLIGFVLFQSIPRQLLLMFDASENMMAIGVPALKTISVSFLIAGVCIILSSVFQSLGRGAMSMIISIARQLLVLLPVAYLLSLTKNVNNVWLAFPIAEAVSLILCVMMMKYIFDKVIKNIDKK